MTKKIKTWLIVALSLIAVGMLAFVALMTYHCWDFKKLSSNKYQPNAYEVSESFDSISIDTETADVRFALSQDGKCKVVCAEQEKMTYSVAVTNNELTVKMIDERKWYDHLFNFAPNEMIVYLPLANYNSLTLQSDTGDVEIPHGFTFENITIALTTGDVDSCANAAQLVQISTTTGDIEVENATVGALKLSSTTGDIDVENVTCNGDISITLTTGDSELENVTCQNFTSGGTTGELSMSKLIASGKITIERDTGDVEFDRCDGGEITVETTTGDVKGSLLTAKTFIPNSQTGDIRVPSNSTGGKCEITTTTGDIRITLA